MSRLLTLFLVLHWAVAFSLLTGLALTSDQGGLLVGLQALAHVKGGPMLSSALLNGVMGFGFGICALLFWWAFLSLFSSEALGGALENILKLAYAVACGMVTVVLVVGAIDGAQGLYVAVAAHLAALIGSYLVIRAELSAPRHLIANNDQRIAVRAIAMNASHAARMQKFVKTTDVKRSFDR